MQRKDLVGYCISIHALREEGDLLLWRCFYSFSGISIHALREEGDSQAGRGAGQHPAFLSTPSARRATGSRRRHPQQGKNFYPRPPRGGRHGMKIRKTIEGKISIHALREEGDLINHRVYPLLSFISIHALREEGDKSPGLYWAKPTYFYPRPPRGGRRVLPSVLMVGLLFLSTPSARRATRGQGFSGVVGGGFLSTPSARRATAKTERKHPAFVSLYTSLHKLQRDVCKPNRKITPLLAQTAGIPVRSVPENHVCCRFALAGHQKISTLSWANSGCSPTCSTLVW